MAEPKDFQLLNEAVAQGELGALFRLMQDWPKTKLNALLAEINEVDHAIEKEWNTLAFKAENFLSKTRGQALDEAHARVFAMLCEISSVVMYYIGKHEERELGNSIGNARTTAP
jgi:hypothetical protein